MPSSPTKPNVTNTKPWLFGSFLANSFAAFLLASCSSTSSELGHLAADGGGGQPMLDANSVVDVPQNDANSGTGGSTGTGGMGGGTGGTSATGGAGGKGGAGGAGGGTTATGGSGGTPSGVVLTASYDGKIHGTWQNFTSQSIFLRGCGTVNWSRLEGTGWIDHGAFVTCGWEGVAVEVAAGGSFTESWSGTPTTPITAGTYRLSGPYGVGCTPGLGLTQAGCSAMLQVASNELVIPGDGGTGSGGNAGTGGAGGTRGGTSGTSATGGAGGKGGTGGAGGGGTTAMGGNGGTPSGVVLTASYDGKIQGTWQNFTSQSIFLRGCGTVDWSRIEGSSWVVHGAFVTCSWEGVAIEVAAGGSFTESWSGTPTTPITAGTYRLSGPYGVGCTPGLGLTQAGCSAMPQVTSNELVIPGDGGTGSGGSAGTGGAGGAGGAGGSGGTGGAATGGAGGAAACQQVGALDQSCIVDSDCLAVRHTTNCCGASVWLGINKAGGQEFSTLESVCDASYPACGCASGPPTTSDGSSISFGADAAVTCQGGVCKTYASACGHLCETGRSCITCGQADAGVSVCSLRCPSGTGCTEAAYSKCLSSFNGGVCVAPDLPCTGY